MQRAASLRQFIRSFWTGKRYSTSVTGGVPPKPIQQDDNYKPLMNSITDGGLVYACAKYRQDPNAEQYYHAKVESSQKKKVIVVGAGIAGLTVAYELSQIGHDVTILELQSRVGGRIKTFREGFQNGLHAEGGAMRIPPNHFLTHAYLNKFHIPVRKFQNYQGKAYMRVKEENVKMKDFQQFNRYYSHRYWPGWNENLPVHLKSEVKGILDYFDRTIQPVLDELGPNPSPQTWHKWIEKWSTMSVEDFLRSDQYQCDEGEKLRPWPEIAIAGYKVATYTPILYDDMVSHLREYLGQWWADNLQTPVNGMDSLPKAFLNTNLGGWNQDVDLSKNIVHGIKVERIETCQGSKTSNAPLVNVYGRNLDTGKWKTFTGDAVFITVPLPILRQIDAPLQERQRAALNNISYGCSTKIMLQCKSRFWQKDVGQGGFSKTDMMIGQLHYPDYDGSEIPDDERGILLVYTWGKDATAFGAQTHTDAIQSAASQITKIHPELEDEFEVGRVQAWCSDPSSQGAFAQLHPYEYLDSLTCLMKPAPPIYLAGEAISWSNAWIQGAIFSSLFQCLMFQLDQDINPLKLI